MRHVSCTEGSQPRNELGFRRGPLFERLPRHPRGIFFPTRWSGSGQAVASRKVERVGGGKVSNLLLLKCTNDTKGWWTEGEKYPTRAVVGGLILVGCDALE